MATDSTHSTSRIEQHPDLMALRGRYAEASAKPISGIVEGLCLLTGLYLAISPWVVNFAGFTNLRISNLITGIALAVLAMGFGSVLERTVGLGWCAIAIGVWTILAPWAIAGPNAAFTHTIVNNAVVGGVAIALGLATMGLGFMGKSRASSSRAR
ncbi:SPW repeat protein [Streptomyces sp. NBC_01198]|uniref:SPW repeat protein n=1 Tax=Streptomyces sp. NBC_01198 TaxID=2903769 RepID=UPI002E108482|nr:SPW repeat protein [Streptomyces sp. NBC_01198]